MDNRPHIICHMLASVDGKIDGASLRAITPSAEYESTGDKLGGNGWLCGRMTMQQHFADEGIFRSKTGTPAGPRLRSSLVERQAMPSRSTRTGSCFGKLATSMGTISSRSYARRHPRTTWITYVKS